MKATQASLLKLMAGTDQQFVIPIYQREYRWKKEQCLRLWHRLGLSSPHRSGCRRQWNHWFVTSSGLPNRARLRQV